MSDDKLRACAFGVFALLMAVLWYFASPVGW